MCAEMEIIELDVASFTNKIICKEIFVEDLEKNFVGITQWLESKSFVPSCVEASTFFNGGDKRNSVVFKLDVWILFSKGRIIMQKVTRNNDDIDKMVVCELYF